MHCFSTARGKLQSPAPHQQLASLPKFAALSLLDLTLKPRAVLQGPELGPAFPDEPTPFFNDPDPAEAPALANPAAVTNPATAG